MLVHKRRLRYILLSSKFRGPTLAGFTGRTRFCLAHQRSWMGAILDKYGSQARNLQEATNLDTSCILVNESGFRL